MHILKLWYGPSDLRSTVESDLSRSKCKKKNVHRSEDQSGCRPTGGIERTMLGCLIRPYWDR
jgi:hypothetical protein